jgi:hypothetical protein
LEERKRRRREREEWKERAIFRKGAPRQLGSKKGKRMKEKTRLSIQDSMSPFYSFGTRSSNTWRVSSTLSVPPDLTVFSVQIVQYNYKNVTRT